MAIALVLPLLATMSTGPAAAGLPGEITTYAGGLGQGPARNVAQRVRAMVGRGALVYMADEARNVVRVLDTTTGLQRIVAGNGTYDGQGPDSTGDGGPALSASLGYINALALDAAGNLYIADSFHYRIRRMEPSGQITIVAGNGTEGDAGDGGPALSASLKYMWGMGFDGAGNLFVSTNSRIRKIDQSGTITTVAGRGSVDVGAGSSPDGTPATEAQINTYDVAVDGNGNFYFGDGFSLRVRKVDRQGILSTVANTCGSNVVGDPEGGLYVSGCDQVQKIDASGHVTLVAGTGAYSSTGDGGPATRATLMAPGPLALDATGNLYIAEVNGYRVRQVDRAGVIATVAGNGSFSFAGDGGQATDAQLTSASDVALDASGNAYIADWANHRVRRVSRSGVITTFAGDGEDGYSGDGGRATAAALRYPSNIALDTAGNVYIASYLNFRIRKVGIDGTISTVAGNGTVGYTGDGGPATSASIGYTGGLAVDRSGNLFIADNGAHRVRKVDSGGNISTVVGTGEEGFGGDGGPAIAAQLKYPNGLTVDDAGNLFIADTFNGKIRKVTPDGGISSIADVGWALGITSDGGGGLFVGDGARVLHVTPTGTAAVAGTGARGLSGDGGPATSAQLSGVGGLAFDGSDLYIADTQNGRIRKVSAVASATTTTTAPPSTSTTSTSTTTTTVPVGPKTQGAAYSLWSQPSASPLDGVGSWMAMANDPTAGAGQRPPAYLFAQFFSFANGTAQGAVGLVDDPGGKFALFNVVDPEGRAHSAVVPFNWSAGRFYFTFVYQLAPGTWGAWVYDYTAAAWVPIGRLSLPPAWGKLSPSSATSVQWYGAAAPSCAAYPRADVFYSPPTGFVGTTASTPTLTQTIQGPGDCTTDTSAEPGAWVRYRPGTG